MKTEVAWPTVDPVHLGKWATKRAPTLEEIATEGDLAVALLAQAHALTFGLDLPYPTEALLSLRRILANSQPPEKTAT